LSGPIFIKPILTINLHC